MVSSVDIRRRRPKSGSESARVVETNVDDALRVQALPCDSSPEASLPKIWQLFVAARSDDGERRSLLIQLVAVQVEYPMKWPISTLGYGSATLPDRTVYMLKAQAPKPNFWGQRRLVTAAGGAPIKDSIPVELHSQLVHPGNYA